MTGGWAATNTLRHSVVMRVAEVGRTEETVASSKALALVETALDAADVPIFLECITEPPCGDCPGCRLAAALRAAREGASFTHEDLPGERALHKDGAA